MIRGIHHVAMNTNNFDRMLAFYRDALGFEVVRTMDWEDREDMARIIGLEGSAGRMAMLRAGNACLELFGYSRPDATGGAPLRPCDHGYTHFCLDVDDVDCEWARLSEAGMTFHGPPVRVGNIKTIYGKDPDGNIIEVQELDPDHPLTLERLGNS